VTTVICDGTHIAAETAVLVEARRRGIKTFVDLSATQPNIADLVKHADVLVASERFASHFAGVGQLESLCHALLDMGPSIVVVTLGDEGSVAMSADDRVLIRQDAFEVDVFDRTGAGDVYHGAFVYGLLRDWELERSVRFANVAAGLSCAGIGGRSAIPSINEIESAAF